MPGVNGGVVVPPDPPDDRNLKPGALGGALPALTPGAADLIAGADDDCVDSGGGGGGGGGAGARAGASAFRAGAGPELLGQPVNHRTIAATTMIESNCRMMTLAKVSFQTNHRSISLPTASRMGNSWVAPIPPLSARSDIDTDGRPDYHPRRKLAQAGFPHPPSARRTGKSVLRTHQRYFSRTQQT